MVAGDAVQVAEGHDVTVNGEPMTATLVTCSCGWRWFVVDLEDVPAYQSALFEHTEAHR